MNLLFLCITTALLVSCSQTVMQEPGKSKWPYLDEQVLNNATLVALERWRTDSLGCLKLRRLEDGTTLIDRFNLKTADKDSVLKVLGQPNYIVDAVDVSTWSYHIRKECQYGPSAEASEGLSVKISRATNKVVHVGLVVY